MSTMNDWMTGPSTEDTDEPPPQQNGEAEEKPETVEPTASTSEDSTPVDTAPKPIPAETAPRPLTAEEIAASSPMSITGTLPYLEQCGDVLLGPGAIRESQLLGRDLPKLRSWQYDIVERAKQYSMDQSVKNILMKQTASHQQNQQKVAMYAQALSLMARIYVGNLPYEMREDEIRRMFTPYGPVKSVHMTIDAGTGNHKGFAFIEFEVPEAAHIAIEQMNGMSANSKNNIKVGKTLNIPQAQPIIEQVFAEGQHHYRVYVASIHPDLSENDLRVVFSAFGEVVDCTLAKMTASGKNHRGYGYITYTNDKSVSEAVHSMNMFDLGGQFLRVGKGVTPPWAQVYGVPTEATNLPTASALAAASITAKICAMEQGVIPRDGQRPSNAGASIIGQSAPKILIGDVRSSELDIRQAEYVSRKEGTAVYAVPPPGVVLPTLSDVPNKPSFGQAPMKVDGSEPMPANGFEYGQAKVGPYGVPIAAQPGEQIGDIDPDTGAVLPPVFRKPNVKIDPTTQPEEKLMGNVMKDKEKWEAQAISGDRVKQRTDTKPLSKDEVAAHLKEAHNVLDTKNKESAKSLAQQEKLEIKGNEQRNMLMHKLMRKQESRVVVLRNMVTPADVDEYLQEEITSECSKYGKVEDVVIVQERIGVEVEDVQVKIFVKFSLGNECASAQTSLNGRFFAGRTIKADTYDENLFNHGEYNG